MSFVKNLLRLKNKNLIKNISMFKRFKMCYLFRERERTEKDARSRDRERYVKEEKRTSYFGGEDREKREQKSTVIEEAEST